LQGDDEMSDSYPFPVYTGILEPKHYKKIGSAIWFFLWCIKSITEESVDEEGVTWGHVYRGAPVKLSEMVEPFGTNEKTIRRWIDTLEQHGYIRVTRAPYGIIIAVRNSKKKKNRSDKNVRSNETDRTKMSEHSDGDRTDMSTLSDKNVHSNKDIIKTFITTTDTEPFEKLLSEFCTLHSKLDVHVKRNDIVLMQWMLDQGIDVDLIIKVMRTVYAERTAAGTHISTFVYYKNAILEAWEAVKAITDGVPIPKGVPLSPVALGKESITDRVPVPAVALGSPKRTKQQIELEELRRKREEARLREQSGSF